MKMVGELLFYCIREPPIIAYFIFFSILLLLSCIINISNHISHFKEAKNLLES